MAKFLVTTEDRKTFIVSFTGIEVLNKADAQRIESDGSLDSEIAEELGVNIDEIVEVEYWGN